jgi:hypothetical protein
MGGMGGLGGMGGMGGMGVARAFELMVLAHIIIEVDHNCWE